jgi:hypothetical protein
MTQITTQTPIKVLEKELYKIGDVIPQTGMYVCVPCGYIQQFIAGELFLTCEACLAGTENGPVDSQDPDSEFWQFIG